MNVAAAVDSAAATAGETGAATAALRRPRRALPWNGAATIAAVAGTNKP